MFAPGLIRVTLTNSHHFLVESLKLIERRTHFFDRARARDGAFGSADPGIVPISNGGRSMFALVAPPATSPESGRCDGACQVVAIRQPDSTMKKYTLEAAPAAGAKELKNQKAAKAKRIVMAADVHLRSYQAARKIDNGAIGAVGKFREPGRAIALR